MSLIGSVVDRSSREREERKGQRGESHREGDEKVGRVCLALTRPGARVFIRKRGATQMVVLQVKTTENGVESPAGDRPHGNVAREVEFEMVKIY